MPRRTTDNRPLPVQHLNHPVPGHAYAYAQGLRGPQGPPGPRGATGQPGPGLNVLGSVAAVEFIPEGVYESGDTYLVEARLYVWNGETWIISESLQGPKGDPGESFRVRDTLFSTDQLPVPPDSEGDLYFVGTALYYWDGSRWQASPDLKGDPGPEEPPDDGDFYLRTHGNWVAFDGGGF